MSRAFYVPLRLLTDIGNIASRAINAIGFGGSTALTLSARAHLEGPNSRLWRVVGRIINAIFFLQENHVQTAWEQEVDRARYVLKRLEGMR